MKVKVEVVMVVEVVVVNVRNSKESVGMEGKQVKRASAPAPSLFTHVSKDSKQVAGEATERRAREVDTQGGERKSE